MKERSTSAVGELSKVLHVQVSVRLPALVTALAARPAQVGRLEPWMPR